MKLWSSLRHQEAIRRATRSSRRGPKSRFIDPVDVLESPEGGQLRLTIGWAGREPGPACPPDTLAHALLWYTQKHSAEEKTKHVTPILE